MASRATRGGDELAERDRAFMRRALALARRGRPHPNPFVGAVLVRGDRIVGEGFHRRRGEPHAEAVALAEAGGKARGGTLYVTLEPCNHSGLTPPCSAAILAAGIRRVVVAARDLDPRVRGRGLDRLRRSGVEVEVGVLAAEAAAQNEAYDHFQRTGLPLVELKLASSLDSRLALASGAARWITGPRARREVHRLRARADAVLVGAGTVRQDDPALTVRLVRGANPVRVVVSGRLDLPEGARVLTDGQAPTWILASPEAAGSRRAGRLLRPGVEILAIARRRGQADGQIDLRQALALLALRGVRQVLVEGGAAIATELLSEGLVGRLELHLAPLLLGAEHRGWLGALGIDDLAAGIRLEDVRVRRLGEDLGVSGRVKGGYRPGARVPSRRAAPRPDPRRRKTG
jgi:diaminohydroxyphosphoribosylaminopyrimidine deaminase/5-amino-6-(5-phosphoribosylamino)uracil reductase